MVDIHTHILHKIDDGSKSVNESFAMCEAAAENNITDIVLTPHFEDYRALDEFLYIRDARAAQLIQYIENNDLKINIHLGAEVAAHNDMLFFNELDQLTIAQSRYILLELPFKITTKKFVAHYIEYVLDNNLIPVIAHPERYLYVQHDPSYIDLLREYDVLFQLNLTSLIGDFGGIARSIAIEMIRSDLAHVIASDTHSINDERNQIINIIGQISGIVPKHSLERLLFENPFAIINDQIVPT